MPLNKINDAEKNKTKPDPLKVSSTQDILGRCFFFGVCTVQYLQTKAVVVVLLFNIRGKQLWLCRDVQLT